MASDDRSSPPASTRRRNRSQLPVAPEAFALAILSIDRFVSELSGGALFRDAGLGAREWAVLSLVGQYPITEAKLGRQLRLTPEEGHGLFGGLKGQGLLDLDAGTGALALTEAGRQRLSALDAAVQARLDAVGKRRGVVRKLPKVLRTLVQSFA